MMNPISDFINNAKGLTRNPLGIIALFISLIYGFACLVLGTSIKNLHTNWERLPLLWFIIIFPIIILGAFVFLVLFHHEKLYAPTDFRGDDSFIQTIDKKKIKEKRLIEIEELKSSPPVNGDNTEKMEVTDTNPESHENVSNADHIQNPEQPKEKLEEDEGNKLLEIYANCEKWTAQELGLKHKILFKRNVSIRSNNYGTFELDALAKDNTRVYVIETRYWTSDRSEKKLKLSIQEFISKGQQIRTVLKRPGIDFKLIIALVFDSLKNVNQSELKNFVTSISKSAEVEFFEYDEMKRSYE